MKEGRSEEARAYLLADPEDTSHYESVQGWKDNVIDVCLPSSLRFMQQVFAALNGMYAEAGTPLKVVHVGGDEVPEGAWLGSPACTRQNGQPLTDKDAARLRGNFLDGLGALLKPMGITMASWEEGMVKREAGKQPVVETRYLDNHPLVFTWNSVWGNDNVGTAYMLANAGYDVVMAQASNLYLDMPHEKDPEEPAQNWAGYVDTNDVFAFAPTNLYASAREDTLGNPIHPCTEFAGKERLSEAGGKHLVGVQASLWSEHILGSAMMESMFFPRALALAERAWARQPAWEQECEVRGSAAFARDWNEFANRLGQRELPRLAYLDGGYAYRIPLPGAAIEKGLLQANINFPGLTIRYTTDGSEPDARSSRYDGPVAARGIVKLRAFDVRGRSSRTTTLDATKK
jgi:hexosaminidase